MRDDVLAEEHSQWEIVVKPSHLDRIVHGVVRTIKNISSLCLVQFVDNHCVSFVSILFRT